MQNREKIWKVLPKKGRGISEQLALNRNISNLKEFINPPSPEETLNRMFKEEKILKAETAKAKKLILSAIKGSSPIYIHGDYDADGLCATAILWEKIYYGLKYKNCFPYIPNRFSEGYGLSKESVDNIIKTMPDNAPPPLLVTVDCGIVSNKEVLYAKERKFKVIICDHHQKGKTLPNADSILWTDRLCAAGISWILSLQLADKSEHSFSNGLDLVSLATIADVQPLTGYNRSLVKYGLKELNKLKRAGIKALTQVSGITDKKIDVYEVGWIIAPRLNSAGRLENALNSLRLLCAKKLETALPIAESLNNLNSERQKLTFSMFEESKNFYSDRRNIVIAKSASFHEGVIGLVAGKLVSEFYVPSIVISQKENVSKGSARSVGKVNIIKFLRTFEKHFESLGGHPMAAGFSIKNEYLEVFIDEVYNSSEKFIKKKDITPELEIDGEISLTEANYKLLDFVESLSPFGLGNPEPVFLTKGAEVWQVKKIGKNSDHLRISLKDGEGDLKNAVAFGFGNFEISPKNRVDIVYTLSENLWNGRRGLDLKIKDIRKCK